MFDITALGGRFVCMKEAVTAENRMNPFERNPGRAAASLCMERRGAIPAMPAPEAVLRPQNCAERSALPYIMIRFTFLSVAGIHS